MPLKRADFGVAADGVDCPAGGGVAHDEQDDQEGNDQDNGRDGDAVPRPPIRPPPSWLNQSGNWLAIGKPPERMPARPYNAFKLTSVTIKGGMPALCGKSRATIQPDGNRSNAESQFR